VVTLFKSKIGYRDLEWISDEVQWFDIGEILSQSTISTIPNPLFERNYSGKKIIMDSAGVLWCCFYTNIQEQYRIYVYKSTDDGETWTDSSFPDTLGWSRPVMVIYDNMVYVFFQDVQIKYCYWNGSAWSAYGTVLADVYSKNLPSVAVDSAGHIHITCDRYNNFRNRYEVVYSYDFGPWEIVAASTTYDYYQPSICTDENNKPHIAFIGATESNSNIHPIYTNKVLGSWSSIVSIDNPLINQSNVCIQAIGTKIHAVWAGRNDSASPRYVKYSVFDGVVWSDWIYLTYGYSSLLPFMDVVNDNIYVLCTYQLTEFSTKQLAEAFFRDGILDAGVKQSTDVTNVSFCYGNNCIYAAYTTNTCVRFLKYGLKGWKDAVMNHYDGNWK